MLNSGARRRGWHRRGPARSHAGPGQDAQRQQLQHHWASPSARPPPETGGPRHRPGTPGGPLCRRPRKGTPEPQGRSPTRRHSGRPWTERRSRAQADASAARRPPTAKTERAYPRATCHGLTGWEGGKEMAMDTVASKFQQRWTIFPVIKHMLSPPPPPFRFSVLGGGGHNNTLVPLGVHQGPRTVYDTG